MLLLAALSAATLAVMVRAALLPTELETNKNGSEALANALRNTLMSENDDYMPRESGEPPRSVASYEEQEPTDHPRARDVSITREQYEDQKQESSKYIPETDDGPEPEDNNIVAIQRPLPVPSDIQDDPNAMMRHDHPKLSRNGGDDAGKNKISFHFDEKLKKERDEYNERDERYFDKEINKYDKLKQSQNNDKRDKSLYNDPGDDNPSKREERHDDFKHINQERDKDKEAETRRDEIDKYKYDKHNDDQRLDRTDDKQTTFDNMKKRHGNQDQPGDHRYEEIRRTLKNRKKSDFIQSERDKRIDIRFGKSVDPVYNDLKALKSAKREYDKINYLRFDKSDDRRPVNLTHDNKVNFKQGEHEKFQINSHVNDDLSRDNRENIRSDEDNNSKPYKSRFQNQNNFRPDDLRQNNPDKLTRDKMRREKSDKFKYDDIRQEYLNENKYNQLKRDVPNNIKYGTRNEQKYSNNRHDKLTKLNEYDRDVFLRPNDKSSESNLKYNKYDDLRQDDLRYDKITHTKRDEMRKDQIKYDKADKRDEYRHEKTDEIRFYDKKKQNLYVTNLKEKKNKHEPHINDNIQEKYYHKQEIKKMGLEHDRIKEKKLRLDYGVDDEYNRQNRTTKQKLDKPRDKPNENPRGLMQSKLNTKQKEVPLKYDKLKEQLEKQFQRINPITESDKESNKYMKNKKKEDTFIKNRNEKYKRINNEYKYKHKQYNENDNNNKRKSNSRYNKDRPFHPQQRARVFTRHPSEDYISEHGNVKYASVTNGINSVYVPRSRDIGNNTNITDNVSSDNGNFEQEPGVSRRDLLYYVEHEKLAGLVGNDDVVDVADVPTVETRRNAKRYKILKTVARGRWAGEGAGRVVQEEGAGGVVLVALDGALPSFQLPRARRQYMPPDSDYKAGDLLDDIPGLNEYPEPNLARMDLNQLSPPGLTASVQGSYSQLYSPSVDGHITPDKEGGHGRALFEAMNVQSVLNE